MTGTETATGGPFVSLQEDAGHEIARALSVFKSPGDLIEIRTIDADAPHLKSGYYHSIEDATRAALDAEKTAKGVYFVFNEIQPNFSTDSPLQPRDRGGMVSNTNIARRRWILVDVDPERTTGTNSTEEEKAFSRTMLDTVIDFLTDMGYPAPVITDSGNGYHCYYRIDLPNDTESAKLVKDFLRALDNKFSMADVAKVDIGNNNAGRITKLPGTMTRKGPNEPDRPHRRSHLLEVPDQIETVTREQIEAVAGSYQTDQPKKKKTAARITATDGHKTAGTRREIIEAFKQKYTVHDILGRYCKRMSEDRYLSPGSTSGSPGINVFKDGRFYTHHKSSDPDSVTDDHTHSSYDALVAYGYNDDEEKAFTEACDMVGMTLQQGTQRGPRGPTPARATAEPEPEEVDSEVMGEAERVLTEEDPLAYFLEVFHTSHVGDDIVAKCCYLSAASRVVATSKGLHVLTIGPSGKGKSSTYDTVLEQIPDRCKVEGSLSDKALLYHNHPEGSIIVRDDKEMSDALQELFRGATSDIRKPYKHHTVLNGKPTTHIFPARCVWWLAASEDNTDDQFHNRCLQPYVDDSKEADRAFTEHFLKSLAKGAKKDPRFAVCRYMWEMISSEVLPVWVWFSEAMKYDTESNRRNTTIFADMIQAVTRMRYKQRKIDPDRGIVASLDDYATAYEIYSALFGDEGSQGTQLTPDEARVLSAMHKMTTDRMGKITLNSLVRQTGITTDKVRRAIHGRKDRNHNPGLLSKCPALTFEKKNTSIPGTDGVTRSTMKNEYTLDERAYIAWKSHGGISLIPDILEKSLVARIARTFPTLYQQMGEAIIGSYGASFPNLTNLIINNNINNNTLPDKEGEREKTNTKGGPTPRLTPSPSHSL